MNRIKIVIGILIIMIVGALGALMINSYLNPITNNDNQAVLPMLLLESNGTGQFISINDYIFFCNYDGELYANISLMVESSSEGVHVGLGGCQPIGEVDE